MCVCVCVCVCACRHVAERLQVSLAEEQATTQSLHLQLQEMGTRVETTGGRHTAQTDEDTAQVQYFRMLLKIALYRTKINA